MKENRYQIPTQLQSTKFSLKKNFYLKFDENSAEIIYNLELNIMFYLKKKTEEKKKQESKNSQKN
jgi:hypothetical protein